MLDQHCVSEGSIKGAWLVFLLLLLPCVCMVFDRQREDNVIASLIYDS